jgi:hypothetical protein
VVIPLLFFVLPQLKLQWPPRRAGIDGHVHNNVVGWIGRRVGSSVHTGLNLFHQFAVLGVDAKPVAAIGATAATAHCGFDPQRHALVGNGRQVLVNIALVGRKEHHQHVLVMRPI